MDKFLDLCVPLHKLALRGNWEAAKVILAKDDRLKHAAIASGWATLLHVAAGANDSHFVEELLQELKDEHIALQDYMGNTAFSFAVASGVFGSLESCPCGVGELAPVISLLKQRLQIT